MSYSAEEEAYEQYLSELFDRDYRDEAIDGFTTTTLQSYYLANPLVGQEAKGLLAEAQALVGTHPRSALVMAYAAIEVAMKLALVRPVVHGLVHSESLADFVTEAVMGATHKDRFKKLLFRIATEYAGIDMDAFSRPGQKRTLWNEIQDIEPKRNGVIHRGGTVDPNVTAQAIEIATTLLRELFPRLLNGLGLHLHGDSVCDEFHPPADLVEALEAARNRAVAQTAVVGGVAPRARPRSRHLVAS